MEIENKYASKGISGTALGLGAGALGLQLLPGLLNGVMGGGACGCSENAAYNRYDASKDARIAQLETEVKLRDANTYTDSKLGALRDYVDGKFAAVNDRLCAQAVHNANSDAVLGCMQGQISQLMGLTKMVVPNTSICPGWGNVTITPAAPTTGA